MGQETTSACAGDSPSSHGTSEKSPVTTQESPDGVVKIQEGKFPFEELLVELELSREEVVEEPISYPEKDILASIIFNTITNQDTDSYTYLPIQQNQRNQAWYVCGAPVHPQPVPVLPTRQTVIKHTRALINLAKPQEARPVSTGTLRTVSPSLPLTTSKPQAAVHKSRKKKRNREAALNTNLKRVQDSNRDFKGKIANLKYHLLTCKPKEKVAKILAATASKLEAEEKKLKDYQARPERLPRIPKLSRSETVKMTPEEKRARTLLSGRLSRKRTKLAKELLPKMLQAEDSINMLLRINVKALKSLEKSCKSD